MCDAIAQYEALLLDLTQALSNLGQAEAQVQLQGQKRRPSETADCEFVGGEEVEWVIDWAVSVYGWFFLNWRELEGLVHGLGVGGDWLSFWIGFGASGVCRRTGRSKVIIG